MRDISNAVKVDAAQIGVSVADVRIRRADLPIEVLQAINARMKPSAKETPKSFAHRDNSRLSKSAPRQTKREP